MVACSQTLKKSIFELVFFFSKCIHKYKIMIEIIYFQVVLPTIAFNHFLYLHVEFESVEGCNFIENM